MELSDIFRIVNLVVAGVTVLGGVFHIFPIGLQNLIIGIYMIVFGLAIALLGVFHDFYPFAPRRKAILTTTTEFQVPPQVSRYANFLFSFIGRGVFYILIGGLLLGDKLISNIAGGIVGIAGIGYIGLEFVPLIEPPSSMREADAGWGAEQV
ncbi:hypothetical protein ACSS6W_000790 [Trichoderma asperelloides]